MMRFAAAASTVFYAPVTTSLHLAFFCVVWVLSCVRARGFENPKSGHVWYGRNVSGTEIEDLPPFVEKLLASFTKVKRIRQAGR